MYFIFAAITTLMLSPLVWAVVLLFIALVSKKPVKKRRLIISSVTVLIIFSNPWLLYLYANCWNVDPAPLDQKKTYSAVIVLGGFTNQDKYGKGTFNAHLERFVRAMELKTTGQAAHIFISGGNSTPRGDNFTESRWAKEKMEQFHIPDTAIMFEDKSRNTVENARFTRQALLQAHLPAPYPLVTSSFHMRRAMYIFKKAGIEVIPVPCDYLSGNNKLGPSDYFVPSAAAIDSWGYYMKELVGYGVAHFQSP